MFMGWVMNYIWILIGYIFGSIPFGLWIGLVFFKKDVRKFGSGNTGGTNTGRVLGKPIGLLTMVLDALKGLLAMLITSFFVKDTQIIVLAGIGAVIGHSFSLFLKFKGGKSVATYFGYLLGICVLITHNYYPFLVAFGSFMICLYLSKMVSLSSMIGTNLGSLSAFVFFPNQWLTNCSLLALSLFIIYRHRTNIIRIRNNTESKIKWM